MSIDLIAEGVVAVLLAVTIAYCFQLNRRLTALRAEQEAMADLVVGLNQATERAQDGIFQLRAASQESEETLKLEVSRARALADELSLITEAGSNLAERIEAGLAPARQGPARQGPARQAPARQDPAYQTSSHQASSSHAKSAPVEPFKEAGVGNRPGSEARSRKATNTKSDDIRRALSAVR